ncbi:uncharacterized protein LOC130420666 [Triplophysa dalaica]|uniref:uncharacterized protein LOC130420666 n=1 Tax=Triplophysa dalaica TaxID=1582913 RepID=UPI0024DF4AF9|nr:uncharacterized protein LOC130420666 [Triplophysa dalaica]
MEHVRQKIRNTLPQLEEEQLETFIKKCMVLGVTNVEDCTFITEADLDGIFTPIQSRKLISVFRSGSIGTHQPVVSDNPKGSKENKCIKTQEKKHSNDGTTGDLANDIKKNMSSKIEGAPNASLPTFKLHLEKTSQNSNGYCRRFTFGKNSSKPNKTIMMIGATGAGKTTLINGMINYILGVRWEDDFRLILIDEGKQKSQAESQTSAITAYQINHMTGFQVPYSLTIVDTPGFGDTRGISRDQEITKQIHEFFTQPSGIDHLDAVCFVVQASLARLTHTQTYIFDSILSIFGKDIAENILMLVTFADGNIPPVLEAIKVSKMPCSTDKTGEAQYFKFNNSALFITQSKSEEADEENFGNFDQMFWKLGFSSLTKFFKSLEQLNTKSLTLTQEVLKERQQLEAFVEGLQPQINAGLAKLEEIKKTNAALMQHKAEMDANKNFEIEVEINVPKQVKKTSGFLTNCQICRYTCHNDCKIADDKKKYKCVAMKDGKCMVCPGKCAWNVHFNMKYKWDYVKERKKETFKELQLRYNEASGKKTSAEQIFKMLGKEFDDVQIIVFNLIESSQHSSRRLQEIALKPNPLSTPDYIDLMIQAEKQEAKPGYKERIESLLEVKKKAETMNKVTTGKMLEEWHVEKEKISNISYNATVIFSRAKDYFGEKIGQLKINS